MVEQETKMIPDDFPDELDGAKILYVARARRDERVLYVDTGEERPIPYFALAQYEGEKQVYCFSVTSNYEVVGDYVEDSLEETKEQAQRWFEIADEDWQEIKRG